MHPTDMFISAGGLRLHVRDWGGPADAGPLLLVHGLASNARIWDLLAPLLAREFRVAALDQRGHGLSDKSADGYDFAAVTRDLAQAIGALGWERPLVVGHSWGANVTLQLAADYPALPSGIVLVDGGTSELAAAMSLEQALERLAPPRLAGTPRVTFIERVRSHWADGPWSQAIEDAIMGNFAVNEQDRIAPHLTYENHLKIVRALWEQRPTQLFPRVDCAALLVPAEAPPSDERAAEWMEFKRRSVAQAEAAIPNVKVAWARDSMHDVQLHHPEWLAGEIASFAGSRAENRRTEDGGWRMEDGR
jgi:pimeloyl-ACP methyl ester carboxylesterase